LARRATTFDPLKRQRLDPPRGILTPSAGDSTLRHSRHWPAPELAFFVEHYWIVHWDRRGHAPRVQQTLPHPSVHIVVEEGRSRLLGVMRGRFTRTLEGKGRVFGIKFKPGAFHPFFGKPVSELTDRSLHLTKVFGADGERLEETILSLENIERLIEVADDFIRARLPERDDTVELVQKIVEGILAEREITKVEEVVDRFGLSKRSLQRLFSRYVGVSPKWVIKRYRLHEAAERLARGEVTDWAQLALDLGYFDQPHFIRDFKAMVGRSPADYASQNMKPIPRFT
jgi:AraC-like DNA-binding protein